MQDGGGKRLFWDHPPGTQAYHRMDKVNADLLALTYGSLVTQLLRDIEARPDPPKRERPDRRSRSCESARGARSSGRRFSVAL